MKQQSNLDNIIAKKSLGQNFIRDSNFLSSISSKIASDVDTNIIEIGPGTGALTDHLIKKEFKSIILIEKDKYLKALLDKKYKNKKNVRIISGDALKINYQQFNRKEKNIIIGNLPFNISTQLLFNWLEVEIWPPFYKSMVLMFQKEVAERIISEPGRKEYGRISVSAQTRCKIKRILNAPASIFFPKPKVDGVILEFTPSLKYCDVNFKKLQDILKLSFSQRRKKIKTTLKSYREILEDINIDDNQRPDSLSVEDYCKLSKLVE